MLCQNGRLLIKQRLILLIHLRRTGFVNRLVVLLQTIMHSATTKSLYPCIDRIAHLGLHLFGDLDIGTETIHGFFKSVILYFGGRQLMKVMT